MGGRETLTNMATLECRVQYLDDRDPFASTNFPEPTRPPSYSFLLSVALENQITGVHRLLQAPHKVGLRSNQYSGGMALENTSSRWDAQVLCLFGFLTGGARDDGVVVFEFCGVWHDR